MHDWCLTVNKNIRMFAPNILEYCLALIQPCSNVIRVMLPRPLCGCLCVSWLTWPWAVAVLYLTFRNLSVLSANQFIFYILVPHPFPVLPFINFPFSFARPHYVSAKPPLPPHVLGYIKIFTCAPFVRGGVNSKLLSPSGM